MDVSLSTEKWSYQVGTYLKKKAWFIDYYQGGKRRRESIGPSKKQAELVLKKRMIEIAEGKFLDVKKEEKIKFEEFANTFLELHSKLNKKNRVFVRDEGLIKNLSSHFAGKRLSEITPQLIEKYKAARIKQVKPATVNRELACFKCMYNKAIEWGKTTDNPVRKVKLFKENNKRLRFLEKEEIIKLLDACVPYLKPIVIVALHTGMRKSEILTLKWQNINFQHDVIYLLETKNGERREVIMNETVKKALIAVPKHPNSPYVFCHTNGKLYYNVRKCFDAALKKCDIMDFKFHDLRHTFASQLVMAGIDLKTVQELLGHKSIEMTMRYSHLSPLHKKKAVEILAGRIDTYKTPAVNNGKTEDIVDFSNLLQSIELKG